MSLINDMLLELDARADRATLLPVGALADLRATVPTPRRVFARRFLSGVLIASLLVAGAVWWQDRLSLKRLSAAPSPVAIAIPTAPAVITGPPIETVPQPILPPPLLPPPREEIKPVQPTRVRAAPVPPITPPEPLAPPTIVPAPVIKLERIRTGPEAARASYEAGLQAWRQGDATNAITHWHTALREEPRFFAARQSLVDALHAQGERSAALALLDEAQQQGAQNIRDALWLARRYVDLGRDDQAISVLDAASRLEGAAHTADYWAFVAVVQQRLNRQPEARSAFEHALAINPGEFKWWLGLGVAAEAMQQWTVARDAYQRVATAGVEERLVNYARQRLAQLPRM